MRDIKYGAGIIIQSILKDFFGCDVQMVGRLVEDQEILLQRASVARDTRPRSPPLKELICLKTSSPVKRNAASTFRISVFVKSRIIIGNLVKNCFLHMKDMMFLVVVAILTLEPSV